MAADAPHIGGRRLDLIPRMRLLAVTGSGVANRRTGSGAAVKKCLAAGFEDAHLFVEQLSFAFEFLDRCC